MWQKALNKGFDPDADTEGRTESVQQYLLKNKRLADGEMQAEDKPGYQSEYGNRSKRGKLRKTRNTYKIMTAEQGITKAGQEQRQEV